MTTHRVLNNPVTEKRFRDCSSCAASDRKATTIFIGQAVAELAKKGVNMKPDGIEDRYLYIQIKLHLLQNLHLRPLELRPYLRNTHGTQSVGSFDCFIRWLSSR